MQGAPVVLPRVGSGLRDESLTAPRSLEQAAERLLSVSHMVVAAAAAADSERLDQLVDRFRIVLLAHIGDFGPTLWADAEVALWRAFHVALLARTRALTRARLLDQPLIARADALTFVVERYRSAVARRFRAGSHNIAAIATAPSLSSVSRRADAS